MNILHIATGSSGNCTLVNKIMIDCGVKTKATPEILCITHTHSDHIGKPPYTELRRILQHARLVTSLEVYEDLLNKVPFKGLVQQQYALDGFAQQYHGDYTITPIPMHHDVPCVGFLIEKEQRYLHITDTVKVDITDNIKNCDYISIEANYDITLLESNTLNGRRHAFVQERVKDTGHLSNDATAKILGEIMGNRTKKVWLIHVSKDNNHEILLKNTFKDERIEIA
jgi:phosphoribosyl 1,2-cyclic phosphodiesterase